MVRSIGVIDYGLGNLRSVVGAIEKLGHEARIISKPSEIVMVEKLVLPGVGAFGDGIRNLQKSGMMETLNREILQKKKPILGICLGFQLMSKGSCEFGVHQGLGWIEANVERMYVGDGLRLPHVGWNDLFQQRPTVLFDGVPDEALFYYVHSFCVCCENEEDIVGKCEYGQHFVAAVAVGNIFGVQFHPEKSQQWGLRVLENFIMRA